MYRQFNLIHEIRRYESIIYSLMMMDIIIIWLERIIRIQIHFHTKVIFSYNLRIVQLRLRFKQRMLHSIGEISIKKINTN